MTMTTTTIDATTTRRMTAATTPRTSLVFGSCKVAMNWFPLTSLIPFASLVSPSASCSFRGDFSVVSSLSPFSICQTHINHQSIYGFTHKSQAKGRKGDQMKTSLLSSIHQEVHQEELQLNLTADVVPHVFLLHSH
jgi:hypothetical protein